MQLILIRHGESEGNQKNVIYGHTDYPLTDRGIEQVNTIKTLLCDCHIDKVFASPLSRAKVLGEALAENCAGSLSIDDRLKEINFGNYENMSRESAIKCLGDDFYRMLSILDHFQIPGGEHQDDLIRRVDSFLTELIPGSEGTYVIATHFGVIKAALHLLMGFDNKLLRQLSIKPGTIIKLGIKPDIVKISELIQTIT